MLWICKSFYIFFYQTAENRMLYKMALFYLRRTFFSLSFSILYLYTQYMSFVLVHLVGGRNCHFFLLSFSTFEIVMRIAGHMRIEESENKTKKTNDDMCLCITYNIVCVWNMKKLLFFIISFLFGRGTHKIIWFENKNAIFYHNFEIDKYE